MKELVDRFVAHVVELSAKPDFVHHEWFVEYHLRIVERIALELCDLYPTADREMVRLMVWLHDYGKIVDFANQNTKTLTAGMEALISTGFNDEIATRAIKYVEIADKKENLESELTPIEVKIVSSADGASHLVGPFFPLYWKENPDVPFQNLMKENIRKSTVDWEKKVVLPEVKRVFENRHKFLLEQAGGQIPEKFFS